MRINPLFVTSLLMIASSLPATAFPMPVVFIPMGIWEYEEKITVAYDRPLSGVSTDTGSNSCSGPCYGFSISSNHQRFSNGPTNAYGYSTIDLNQKGNEEFGFRVKWTWNPPQQNPNYPPTSFDVISTAYTSVAVLEGNSPAEDNSGGVAGASAAIFGSLSTGIGTYGHGLGTYSDTPNTLIEHVSTSGQKTSKVGAHTVAYVTDPSQHFTSQAWLVWGYQ